MTLRIFTLVIFFAIFIPLMVIGGAPSAVLLAVLSVITYLEMLKMKEIPFLSLPAIISIIGLIAYILSGSVPAALYFLTDMNILILILTLLVTVMLFSKQSINIEDVAYMLFGVFYIGNGFQTMLTVRMESLYLLFYFFIVIWSTDTGAYGFGKLMGKRKLAPQLSPNKTVEGFLGGILLAVIVANIYLFLIPATIPLFSNIFVIMIISIAGQLGDLVESAIKRKYDFKDSGNILPGHGGMFDRFDSSIFVMNLVKLLLTFIAA